MFNGEVIVGDSAVFAIKVTVLPGWTNFNVQLTGLAEGDQLFLFYHSYKVYHGFSLLNQDAYFEIT